MATPEPVGNLAFKVAIDGVTVGRFSECSGLTVEIEVTEHQEGGLNDFVHKLPSRVKYPNLVLKQGITEEAALLDWLLKIQQESERPKVTVVRGGAAGQVGGPDAQRGRERRRDRVARDFPPGADPLMRGLG